MENKNIIIILIVIIIILSVIAGTMFLQSGNSKKPTEVKVISDPELSQGDKLEIQLATLNGTAITKENVNIVISDKNGEVLTNQTVKTDSDGEASIDLDLEKGKYDVVATFSGNEIYNWDNVTQVLRIDGSSSGSDAPGSISLELPEFDTKYSKTVGEYRVEAEKWQGGTLGGFGVWLYKNGELVYKDSYLSRAYFYMDGEWKWSEWGNGEGAAYHKYPVSNDVEIKEIEVKF